MLGSRNASLVACGLLLFAAVIANAALKFYNVRVLIDNAHLIAHTHEVKERLNSLMTYFAESSAAVRGYAIAGDDELLKPYRDATKNIDGRFDELTNLVSDNPSQIRSVDELRTMHRQHQKFLDETVAAYRTNGADAAQESVRSRRGNALIEGLRERIKRLVTAEDRLLAERIEVAEHRYRTAIVTGGVGTALSLAIALVAVIVVSQELRRRRAAEAAYKTQAEEARLAAERFRLLSETVPVKIWMSRPDGAVVFLNESWANYTGLAVDGEGLAEWMSAIHPEDADRIQATWAKVDGKPLYLDEVRVRRGEDQSYRWHRCSIVPVRTRGGELRSWVGTLSDIQDQKDQAAALEQAVDLRTQELRRANNSLQEEIVERIRAEDRVGAVAVELRRSNEELEKFAYVASHDLQEPLRKIQAFGDRLVRKSRDSLDDAGRDYLERMMAAATRMRSLIDDLLAFSRVASQTRPYEPVDLNATLANVLGDLEATLSQSGGRVDATELPTIDADPLQMRQLVQNLVANALKFRKPGQPPVVSIRAVRLADLPVDADPPQPAFDGWRLSFADNGIGFDQVHERRIFELFQRLHGRDEYPGTGLGLAICRKITERHGGAMHARGEPGVGATFYVDLPAKPTPAFVVPP